MLEKHKSGVPHLHVLLDRFIPQAWISEAWSALGGGRIVFIERVDDLEKVGWYLGKYLTKAMLLSSGRGVRRYTTSRGVKVMPKRDSRGWVLAPAPLEELREVAGESAVEVVEDERGHVKFFAAEKEIKRMKAFGGRLMMVSEVPGKKGDGISEAEKDVGVVGSGVEDERALG